MHGASHLRSAPATPVAHRRHDMLRGRLRLLQLIWGVLVSCDLFVLIVSLPTFYRVLHTPCIGPIAGCILTDQLTPPELAAINRQGISLHTYALAVFGLDLVTSDAFLLVGGVIIWRRANTWMGLFVSFLLIDFGALGLSIAHGTSLAIALDNPVNAVAADIQVPLTILAYLCLGFFFFTFPNGRLVPRWSWALIAIWVVNFVVFVAPPRSPLNISNWPQLSQSCWLFAVFGISLSTQVYRYFRRASSVEQQQIKWLIFGFVPVLVLPICFAFLQMRFPSFFWQAATEPLYRVYYLPVPLCIGIAILLYRLWDIDVIISRTLVYGVLTTLVVGGYILVVGGLGALLQTHGSLAPSLIATGTVAVLFQPARRALQQGVNRVLYGQRDEPYAVIAHLGRQLEAALPPDAVLPMVATTIQQALKLPYTAIVVEDSAEMTAVVGEPRGEILKVPLIHRGEPIGQLLLSPRSPGESWSAAERRLLGDLAHSAGAAVQAVRLTHELRGSREKLVLAREEERRRLRRDLHDDLGPSLAALALKAATVADLITSEAAKAKELIAELRHELRMSVGEVRRLAHDLRPPTLDELGLVAAIRERAERVAEGGREGQLQVAVEAPDQLPPLSAAGEVAAFRIVQEALMNVLRHAHARYCLIRLVLTAEPAGAVLDVTVTDDGIGLPDGGTGRPNGIGLRSMQERAAELGGTCTIERLVEGGTRVHASIPSRTTPREAVHGSTARADC